MENKEQLPWDLIEEILSRVSPESLVRFRIVSKQWNRLFNDETFINNHTKTFRFILRTKSKLYSVSINPKIEVRELTLDIPGLESQIPNRLFDCNGLLLCRMGNGAEVSNPWLGQTRWIENDDNQPNLHCMGIGYDNDNRYKTLSYFQTQSDPIKKIWKVHDFSSCHELKRGLSTQETKRTINGISCVSLDGALYWYGYQNTNSVFCLVMFDFSTEVFYGFCGLPCGGNPRHDALVLSVFKGDRFSFLKQCHLTKKIEVWVTKNKIHKFRGRDVEWINVMDALVPNLPVLKETWSQPSYFIEGKRLVVCSCDKTGRAWIYVVEDNKLISKVRIDLVVDLWPLHCTFFPSLVSVPRGQREQAEKLQL